MKTKGKKIKPIKAWAIIDISELRLTKTLEVDYDEVFCVFSTRKIARQSLANSSSRYGVIPVLIKPL